MVVEGVLGRQLITATSHIKALKIDSGLLAGVCHAQAFTTEQHELVLSRIASLCRAISPNAIFRAIAEIVVNPLNFMQWGTGAHIRQKVAKVSPSVTDRDPSLAIMLEHAVTRIGCASDHGLPRAIFRRSSAVSAMPMFRSFKLQAAARFRMAVSKLVRSDRRAYSTGTQTDPIDSFWMIGSTMQNGESSKCLPCQINCSATQSIKIDAAARFGGAVFKSRCCNNDSIAAHTLTFPSGPAIRRILDAMKSSQPVKLLTRQIKWLHTVTYNTHDERMQQSWKGIMLWPSYQQL